MENIADIMAGIPCKLCTPQVSCTRSFDVIIGCVVVCVDGKRIRARPKPTQEKYIFDGKQQVSKRKKEKMNEQKSRKNK